jgi:hypothetical protein
MAKIEMIMDLLGGSGGKPWLGQIQTITPPVANTLEEAVANTRRKKNPFTRKALGAFRAYLAVEDPKNPYSDRQIIDFMSQKGYNFTRRDIAYVRTLIESERE